MQTTLREWLIEYIERAFANVELGDGTTLYEAAFESDYGDDPLELARAEDAERSDWRRVPTIDLFSRNEAIFFMNSEAKRFYSPAILRAVLVEGAGDTVMFDSFLYDLAVFVSSSMEHDIPFAELYNAKQRAAFVRFLKFAAFNAPREFGYDIPVQILGHISELEPAPRVGRQNG